MQNVWSDHSDMMSGYIWSDARSLPSSWPLLPPTQLKQSELILIYPADKSGQGLDHKGWLGRDGWILVLTDT